MGDQADMMMDGTMCQSCGVYIGNGEGFPVSCNDCGRDKIENPWTVQKEQARQKKIRNKEWSTNKLKQLEIPFSSHSNGVHLKIEYNGFLIDFWPSTGKFIDKKTGKHRRGIHNLLNLLRMKKDG